MHRAVEFEKLEAAERDDVGRALARLLHNDDAPCFEGWSPRWVIKKPRSVILLVETDAPRERWIIKRQRIAVNGDRANARQRTIKEAEYQEVAREAAADVAGCKPVPVVATYPDLLVQVQEYVEGVTLGEVLLRTGCHFARGRQRTLEYVGRCATWLASFVDNARRPGAYWDAKRLIDGLAGNWALFRARYPRLARQISEERLVDWLQVQCAQLPQCDRAAVYCHGDFGPGNIVVTRDGQLVLLDFASGGESTCLTDACYFLHQLWQRRFNPLLSGRVVLQASESFICHFGKDRLQDSPLLRFEHCRRHLTTLARMAKRDAKRDIVSRVHDRWFTGKCAQALWEFMAEHRVGRP